MFGRKISPFYRTSSPIGAAAQKGKKENSKRKEKKFEKGRKKIRKRQKENLKWNERKFEKERKKI